MLDLSTKVDPATINKDLPFTRWFALHLDLRTLTNSNHALILPLTHTDTRNSECAEQGWIARCGWMPRRG